MQILAGGRYFVVTKPNGEVIAHGNAWTFASVATMRAPEVASQEVLYIGKAYGRDPNAPPTRNTFLRTKAHEKIQQIVNDHLASDSDIFLTPLWFSDRGSSFTNDDFIDDHELGPSDLQRVSDFNHEPGYGHRVALAEEALIAYFKPEHNDNLREWGRTLTASAREMRATGLRVLSVTVTNDNGVTLLYSPHAPDARLSHRARFVVGMTEQEMRGIRHVKPDGDSVGDDIDAFINDIEDSRPAGLIAGVALPDEKAIANRQGSGRAKGFKPKKRRILAEQEYEPNKKSPTPMERIMRRRGFELQGRPGIHIKGVAMDYRRPPGRGRRDDGRDRSSLKNRRR